jgi:hypothetical protein
MALLPAKNIFDGSKSPATTTGEMKSALGTVRDWLADLFGVDSSDKAGVRALLGAAPIQPNILSKSVAGGATVALTADEALNDVMIFTGLLTANIEVDVPATAKDWASVKNLTTGLFTLTLKTAAGTGVPVTQGKALPLYCDGINVLAALTDFPSTTVPTAASATEIRTGTDNTKFVTAAGLAATVSGLGGQTWIDETASRALGATYTNNSGKDLEISGYVTQTGGAGTLLVTRVNGINLSVASGSSSLITVPFYIRVPSGATYSIVLNSGSATLTVWGEYR